MYIFSQPRLLERLFELRARLSQLAQVSEQNTALVKHFGYPIEVSQSLIKRFRFLERLCCVGHVLLLSVQNAQAEEGRRVFRNEFSHLPVTFYRLLYLLILFVCASQVSICARFFSVRRLAQNLAIALDSGRKFAQDSFSDGLQVERLYRRQH